MPQTKRQKLGVAQMVFLEVLQMSRGVKKPEMRDCEVKLAEERIKFVKEFGADVGGASAENIRLAMHDAIYLRQCVESSICCVMPL